ncbi:Uncharacterized protein OS=uncultured bacterium GN=ACD_58C00120G0004 PE=4 SV=1: DUF4190 [Gemmata massiliana]|uniref:DUF4190 domain-containing protein n=1 Tax=Gemmata massiliana TaxID=1210884 RepID=A0A6P2D7E5_9BACT|nr:DUF4190 domain-containing protein [Gemmata massiliana]VTR96406.1 Uncharacterized protein OS=uncultured bacterium GN=ACD_58C00120G0004 PE=4 SV=1: DUF4190 [Gemmata massiliana]
MSDDTPFPEDRPNRRPPRERDGDESDERPRRPPEDGDEYDDYPRPRRRPREDELDPALKMVVPLNTSALAIIAGYIGLVSVLCLPAPFALLFGILALVHLKKNPKLDGKVRAIFAIVMGAVFSTVLAVLLVVAALGQIK